MTKFEHWHDIAALVVCLWIASIHADRVMFDAGVRWSRGFRPVDGSRVRP